VLVFLVALVGLAGAAVYIDTTTPVGRERPGTSPGGGFGVSPLPPPTSPPAFMYPPISHDVGNNMFSISWVADQPVNASVEYCASGAGCGESTLTGTAVKYDVLQFNSSHVALMRVFGLTPATTYYYRAAARNESGGASYFPSAPPYPSVVTKSVDPGTGNSNPPIFWVRPYADLDASNSFTAGDQETVRFIAYMNHSPHSGHSMPTGTIAVRAPCAPDGAGDCKMITFTSPFSATYSRNSDAAGALHPINTGDTVTFFVAGVHREGSTRYYYWNSTATLTNDGSGNILIRDAAVRQGTPVFPEASLGQVAAAAVLVVGALGGRRLRRLVSR
jgi:hypothetical protein